MNLAQKPHGGVLIADSASLAALCRRLSAEPYITIDTEFLRDKTFWPQLCLVQLASPMRLPPWTRWSRVSISRRCSIS